MDSFEERGRNLARAHALLLTMVDDALAGLDIGHPEVTRSRLESVWLKLQELQRDGFITRSRISSVLEMDSSFSAPLSTHTDIGGWWPVWPPSWACARAWAGAEFVGPGLGVRLGRVLSLVDFRKCVRSRPGLNLAQ